MNSGGASFRIPGGQDPCTFGDGSFLCESESASKARTKENRPHLCELRFGLGLGVDQRVDLVGGGLRPAEAGVAIELLLGELSGGLGEQLGALHGILRLDGKVGYASAVRTLGADTSEAAVDLFFQNIRLIQEKVLPLHLVVEIRKMPKIAL